MSLIRRGKVTRVAALAVAVILMLSNYTPQAVSAQAAAESPPVQPPATPPSTIVVPNGTRVGLSFTSEVNPKTNAEGSSTTLTVTSDVIVEQKVVIRAGTSVQGEVLRSRKKGALGKAAEIAVIIRSVQAVDGTNIPVTATKSVEGDSKVTEAVLVAVLCCILGLLIKGSDAGIPQGTVVEAVTAGNSNVSIR